MNRLQAPFRLLSGTSAVIAILATANVTLAQQWELVDLGEMTNASTINNYGVVGGGAYRYTPGLGVEQVLQLGGGPLSDQSFTHINDDGDYVGTQRVQVNGPGQGLCAYISYPVNSDPQAFSVPYRIGDSGIQVGECQGDCDYPFRINHACMRNLDGTLTNIGFGETPHPHNDNAVDINSSNAIVGSASRGFSPAGDYYRAFRYLNGEITDLGTLGGENSAASAINDTGVIVGWSEITPSVKHAFRYDTSQHTPAMEDLGALLTGGSSVAKQINESGTVVGIAYPNQSSEGQAVMWTSGQTISALSDLLPTGSNWTLLSADAVNDLGEILGTGYVTTTEQRYSAFLLRPRPATGSRLNNDFSGDSVGDDVVWRPTEGRWYVRNSSEQESASSYQWGLPGDIPLRGDFDGDNLVDLTVWRVATGTWYRCYSEAGYNCSSGEATQFGLPVDYPLAADFDGDNKDDLIVWRPLLQVPGLEIEGQWYVKQSSHDSTFSEQWGLRGDLPVADDFDGDGHADLAVWRPSTGTWYVLNSTEDYNKETALVRQWGLPGDHPMPMDIDGDGKAELAVWRPSNGNWYFCRSRTNFDCSQGIVHQWGLPGDVPVRGNFDGTITANLTVWRPSNGSWYSRSLSSGNATAVQWGLLGDKPIGSGIKSAVE